MPPSSILYWLETRFKKPHDWTLYMSPRSLKFCISQDQTRSDSGCPLTSAIKLPQFNTEREGSDFRSWKKHKQVHSIEPPPIWLSEPNTWNSPVSVYHLSSSPFAETPLWLLFSLLGFHPKVTFKTKVLSLPHLLPSSSSMAPWSYSLCDWEK